MSNVLEPQFQDLRVDTSVTEIAVSVAGSGPPLLLLHGFPETRAMWHRIAGALSERYTVIAADLRGYGDSGKPPSEPGHASYSKRAMAADMVEVMAALGHERFLLAAHDRGARVAMRLALDHPAVVRRLCLMDIVPSSTFYEGLNRHTAAAYWHWLFLIQPSPMPETVMRTVPDLFLGDGLRAAWRVGEPGPPEVLAEYARAMRDPETLRGMCEDYRAGATIDCAHEVADRQAGRRIGCPTLLLWSAHGLVGRAFDPLGTWREWCDNLQGEALDCGHFLPEERPDEVLAALISFLEQS